ncbi:MAG: phage major capsid protein [Syntrophomonadaceae bacterium]|nr:phage major capsid protein [Syntrophomonadaceae bacterium]
MINLLKALLAKLDALYAEAKALNEKPDAILEEIQAKQDEIKVMKAKIEAQKELDAQAAIDNTPAEPIIAPVVTSPRDAKKWKGGLGEFLQAVAGAYKPGGQIDNRLLTTPQAAASGMGVGIGADGGFMLDGDLIEELQKGMLSEASVAPLIRMVPLGPNSNSLKTWGVDETARADGSRWGGVQAYWAAEAATVTASKPSWRKLEIELEKLMAICYATDELLNDATALRAIISLAYAEEMAYKLDDAIINGSGIGQPVGMLTGGALISITKETGQPNDTVVHENIQKMWNRMIARNRKNAVWYINQELEPQLENMVLPIGTGGAISPLAKEFIEKRTLYNRPVIAHESCAKPGDVGDILLTDPKQYLGIDKENVQATESIHVRFLYDEMAFRFIYRFNGAPYRNSAITPAKGSSGYTLSSFVTLGAR